MTAHFETGHVVFRQWDRNAGLNEVSQDFRSIDELFSLCLQTDDKLLVDRIIMDGVDSSGSERTITLIFQSTSIHHQTNE